MSKTLFSMAFGVGTQNRKGEWLEVYYAQPLFSPNTALTDAVTSLVGYQGGNEAINITVTQAAELAAVLKSVDDKQASLLTRLAESNKPLVAVLLAEDSNPSSVPEAYLKLHLLSHRLVKPHGINLTGIFGLLPNVAWTNLGAIDVDELAERQLEERIKGRDLKVNSIDKFPRMSDYVIPKGVRIANTARVRLGAYLGEGTTVMHEGFVNFNAGTEGPNMVEGRISAGVFVGSGTDLGGGCSTMGTLSGGGDIVISVGRNCLIGANAGIGIPLGNNCTVEAGLYITAGTKVATLSGINTVIDIVKAKDLAGQDDLLFRRNSETGQVECKNQQQKVTLNSDLHKNN